MALAVSVRFDMEDAKGKTSFTKVRVPTGFSISQYQEFAVGMAQLITDMSNCTVTRAGIILGIDISGLGLKVAAGVLADVYEKARFQFSTAVAGFKAFFRLPGYDETKSVTGSDAVDQADIDVAALITAYTNGIVTLGGTIQPTDNRGNDITAIQFAREAKRRKR